MATTAHEFVLARVSWAARVIHRFSTWGAGAALVMGGIAFLAVLPWLATAGPGGALWAALLAVALVVAPLRVMWHGRRIRTAYGDRAHIVALIEEVPGAMAAVVEALQGVTTSGARGVRRVVPAWRSLLAIRRVLVSSPFRERFDVLVRPLRPDALALTTAALWVTLVVLVLGVPVAVVSLVALVLT